MTDTTQTERPEPSTACHDLVQRGTDRFHDQQAEARRLVRQQVPRG
jgi:hypothetical protein